MARWEEAHDALLDLYKDHNDPRMNALLNAGWWEPNLRLFESGLEGDGKRSADFFRKTFYNYADQIAAMAFNADPIYVDPDMMTVAEAAAASFQPEPLIGTDIPTEIGFLYLPRAVQSHLAPLSMMTHVVTDSSGRIVGDVGIEPTSDEAREAVERMGYINASDEEYRRAGLVPMDRRGPMPPGDRDASWDAILWAMIPDSALEVVFFNRTSQGLRFQRANVAPFGVEIPADERGPAWRDFRFLQTLWRLMAQTIAVSDHRLPGGQFRKRAKRLLVEPKRVTVVTLRRPHPGEADEHRDVPWSHRWIVSGHWRRQYYKSLGIHRQIWISPYVKGPEDLPLVVRKVRAFQLVR